MRPFARRCLLALCPLLGTACLLETQAPPVPYNGMVAQQMGPAPMQDQYVPVMTQPASQQPLMLNQGAGTQFQYNVQLMANGAVIARPMIAGPAVRAQATACFNVSMGPDGTVTAQPGAPVPGATGRIVLAGPLSGYQLSAQADGTVTARPTNPIGGAPALQVQGGVASLCYSVQTQPDGTLVAQPSTPNVLQFGTVAPQSAGGGQAAPMMGPPVVQGPPQNVVSAAQGGACAYRCAVDTQESRSDCQGPVTLSAPSTGSSVAAIDMAGYTEMQLTLQLCNPRGWVFNLGDSPSNNGYGGDSGQFSNDAEVQLVNEALSVYGSDSNPQGGARMLYQNAAFGLVGGCIERRLRVRDGVLQAAAPAIALQSPALLRLNAPDTEGAPDQRWYLGMNRVIADTSRTGSGLNRVEFCLR